MVTTIDGEQPAAPPAHDTSKGASYLPLTQFDPADPASYYTVEIDQEGPIVYSECCADRVGLPTARLLHAALGRWIADQP